MQSHYRPDIQARLQERVRTRHRSHHRRTRRRRAVTILLTLFAAGLLLGGIYLFSLVGRVITAVAAPPGTLTPPDLPAELVPVPPSENAPVNILVLGVDEAQVLTDVLILVHLDPEQGTVNALWIPRDTLTELVPLGVPEKINHAYAYGEGEAYRDPLVRAERPFRSMKTVGKLLGTEVHYHITVNFRAFAQVVDRLGGVQFNVPFAMDYDDPYQNLSIHIKPGEQWLNGENALKVARWRHNNDFTVTYPDQDLGRIRTQQALLKAILQQTLTVRNLPKLPGLAIEAAQSVKTNMDEATLHRLLRVLPKLGSDAFELHALAGEAQYLTSQIYQEKTSYFVPDPAGLSRFADIFNGIDREANRTIWVEVGSPLGAADPAAVELGLELQAYGFQVLPAVTDPRRPDATTVIDLGDHPAVAAQVARSVRVALGHAAAVVVATEKNSGPPGAAANPGTGANPQPSQPAQFRILIGTAAGEKGGNPLDG